VPIEIESADDPRVAEFLGLRDRPEHDECFIAESELVVRRLVTSKYKVRSFLLSPERYERMQDVVDPVGAPIYVCTDEVMKAIAGYDVHRGVLASATRRRNVTLLDALSGATRIVVLEGSNDAMNIGAVARSARALGFDALILDPTCADPLSRRSVRVSMGEILHLKIVRCTVWPLPLEHIRHAGFETWALTPARDANSLFKMGMPDKVALVAGAEGPGLTDATRRATDFDVRIPMHHGVDSLNIGHALAIAMAAVSAPVA
jgi:tRNA G18 (ribose-2'-O)-methylase SpoU